MKSSTYSHLKPIVVILAFALIAVPFARAQTASQEITLRSGGWTAIWLEVEPVDADGQTMAPEAVFSHDKISIIASPKPLAGLAEFFANDPGSENRTFNQDGWEQWYKNPKTGETSNLAAISGNRPYLIKVGTGGSNITMEVTGKARFFRPDWKPDRYNLVGFGLKGTPSFGAFFGPSGGRHPITKIFRLKWDGDWEKVTEARPMKSGEAYWIFSEGPSNYMGPVAVDFDHSITGRLNFGGPGDAVKVGAENLDLKEILFSNLASPGSGSTPELDLISRDAAGLTLRVVFPDPGSLGYTPGNQVDSTPGAGSSSSLGGPTSILTLGAGARAWTTGLAGRMNLYRLNTGANSASFYLPVTAVSSDLLLPTDIVQPGAASTAGLWVGEVIVDSVTSIVEAGGPVVKPAASAAPLRIIMHSTGSTGVLLSQVTIMQTHTADPDTAPTPVIVVDPAQIPFFEGIKERNGKKVGIRLEAVAYDMPRKLDATSQTELLADAAYPSLTDADGIAAFLRSRPARPSSLAEAYHLSWPMSGPVGAGQTVIVTDLTLDPFHRSNPFRHAFHQKHKKGGPNIVRNLSIVFDAGPPIDGRLSGSYSETIKGLTTTDLTLTGRVEMRRVSDVASLSGAQ